MLARAAVPQHQPALCVSASGFGLRCRCLVEKENTRCRPQAKQMKQNGELRVAVVVRKGRSPEDRALLGRRVDVRQDGPKVRSLVGQIYQFMVNIRKLKYFLTWNDFYIAGTTNCFSIKNIPLCLIV